MIRDLDRLEGETYDVLIVGGGIYGAAAAWEAASRGLSVALLEKADFASATSANSLKIIHGGFRYLQHLDLPRVRESILERKVLMRIAGGLVRPLPVLVPASGHGLRGREALAAALLFNDLLGFDRNGLEDPGMHIPRGRLLSAGDCRALEPALSGLPVDGCALFYDAIVEDSERLVLGYLHQAYAAGAALANRVEVTGYLRRGEGVCGVQAVDGLSGAPLKVHARLVLNTAGPWVQSLAQAAGGKTAGPGLALAQAINLVTRKAVFERHAVGLLGDNGYRDGAAPLPRSSSLLFVVPWRGASLIGTSYRMFGGDPGRLRVSGEDVDSLLEAFNAALPGQQLGRADVAFVHAGLLPALPGEGAVRLTRRPAITDHARQGIFGLISIQGVKYTTARRVACRVVDEAFRRLGRPTAPSISALKPLALYGERHDGTVYAAGDVRERVAAAVRFAVAEEMALSLEDLFLRRSGWGSAGRPDSALLQAAADAMAQAMSWSAEFRNAEIRRVEKHYDHGSSTGMDPETVPQISAQAA